MKNMETKTTSSGIGLTGLVFIVFLVLKLTHVIDWSWWWVTAPIWVPLAIAVVSVLVAVIYQAITGK